LEELKKQFDYIVLDLPPVNIVSDAISVSNFISGMIVVVREEYCERKELAKCVRQLNLSNANILGFVMACVNSGGGSYGKYNKKYKYYKYKYYKSSSKGEK
jgi:Mrp family chromosome partitioning ATPase